ncbi:hypothetical protein ABVT39_019021 [Epinephelus coioides]
MPAPPSNPSPYKHTHTQAERGEEGLVRAIDAGSPPAGSPVGRTAHHSISLNSNTKGLLATNTGGGC